MPTVPFRTDAVEYALGNPVFDVKRTPSRMGLITEVFRRTPGVVRSIHPTHSVAAWGQHAREIIAGHERSMTPCGRATPYGRLLQHSGKILFLGVSAGTMTFSYFVAEELEPRLSRPVLTASTYPMQWKDRNGILRLSHFRLFCVDLDHDPRLLVAELKRRKQWREGRAGSLGLILLEAVDVYRAAAALAERGQFLSGRPTPAAGERMAYA
jgi:aminoglycoside 3-N-acetyltransferase